MGGTRRRHLRLASDQPSFRGSNSATRESADDDSKPLTSSLTSLRTVASQCASVASTLPPKMPRPVRITTAHGVGAPCSHASCNLYIHSCGYIQSCGVHVDTCQILSLAGPGQVFFLARRLRRWRSQAAVHGGLGDFQAAEPSQHTAWPIATVMLRRPAIR